MNFEEYSDLRKRIAVMITEDREIQKAICSLITKDHDIQRAIRRAVESSLKTFAFCTFVLSIMCASAVSALLYTIGR